MGYRGMYIYIWKPLLSWLIHAFSILHGAMWSLSVFFPIIQLPIPLSFSSAFDAVKMRPFILCWVTRSCLSAILYSSSSIYLLWLPIWSTPSYLTPAIYFSLLTYLTPFFSTALLSPAVSPLLTLPLFFVLLSHSKNGYLQWPSPFSADIFSPLFSTERMWHSMFSCTAGSFALFWHSECLALEVKLI